MKGKNKMKKIKWFVPTIFDYIIVNKKNYAKYGLLRNTKKVNFFWKSEAKADDYLKRNNLSRKLYKVEKVAL